MQRMRFSHSMNLEFLIKTPREVWFYHTGNYKSNFDLFKYKFEMYTSKFEMYK